MHCVSNSEKVGLERYPRSSFHVQLHAFFRALLAVRTKRLMASCKNSPLMNIFVRFIPLSTYDIPLVRLQSCNRCEVWHLALNGQRVKFLFPSHLHAVQSLPFPQSCYVVNIKLPGPKLFGAFLFTVDIAKKKYVSIVTESMISKIINPGEAQSVEHNTCQHVSNKCIHIFDQIKTNIT